MKNLRRKFTSRNKSVRQLPEERPASLAICNSDSSSSASMEAVVKDETIEVLDADNEDESFKDIFDETYEEREASKSGEEEPCHDQDEKITLDHQLTALNGIAEVKIENSLKYSNNSYIQVWPCIG